MSYIDKNTDQCLTDDVTNSGAESDDANHGDSQSADSDPLSADSYSLYITTAPGANPALTSDVISANIRDMEGRSPAVKRNTTDNSPEDDLKSNENGCITQYVPNNKVKEEDGFDNKPRDITDSVKRDLKLSVEPSPKRAKGENKIKRSVLEDILEPICRWWESINDDMDYDKTREYEKTAEHWTYLEHNGMIFTPEYVPHGVPMLFKGEVLVLTPDIEEVATMWAQSMGSNYENSDIYRKNFWSVFTEKFPKGHPIRKSGAKLSDCDFTKIKEHLENEKIKKKENREFYLAKAERTAALEHKYNYALVDWIREKTSSNKLEPPGLFKGRGLHPKQGLLKCRMFPRDVILNLSKDAPVPKVTMLEREGHSWKDVYHDNSVTWLAYYKDSINDQFKYMYLAAQSKFKGLHDLLKYNKARELKSHIEKIRRDYRDKMFSLDMYEKQLGTATYLIDFLALRVGGEKDADEADTVGCCSLRVEHLIFDDKKPNVITLDFLGKDSIRYFNTVTIDEIAYENLRLFTKRKKPSVDVFSMITTAKLNDYLKEMMDGLSAKVFRTYNASITLQNLFKRLRCTKLQNFKPFGDCEVDKPINVDVKNISELIKFYNDANREVAILCNHQRSIPKQHEASMSKMKNQYEVIKEDIEELTKYIEHLESKSTKEFEFTSKVKDVNGNPRKLITKPNMKLESCKNKLLKLKLVHTYHLSSRDIRRFPQDEVTTILQTQPLRNFGFISFYRSKKKNHSIKMKMKDSNKTVALGTSKINYMDPRITVAFCKRYEIPIEKIFNKSLRTKFPWAMFVKSDFTF